MAGWCVFDLDRTLIEDRTVQRLATHFGREEAVVAALSPRGEPNAGVGESRRVMACFAGVSVSAFDAVCADQLLREGALEACQRLRAEGWRLAVATAGYEAAARQAAKAIGAEAVAALRPKVRHGRLTGDLHPFAWQGECGRAVCKGRFVAPLDRPLVAVGDGANDVCMFQPADLAVAITPCHADAAAAADACIDSLAELPQILSRLAFAAEGPDATASVAG